MPDVPGRFFRDLLQELWKPLSKTNVDVGNWLNVRALGFSFFVLDLNQEVLHLGREVVKCCVR